jgi:hypothetical protein
MAGFRVLIVSVLLLVAGSALSCKAALPLGSNSGCRHDHVTSTAMEAALDELRKRFPNEIVIGFEEFRDDPRPDCEPKIDLGPPATNLNQAIERVRQADPKYHVELEGKLLHVQPENGMADPAGLLDLRLPSFAVPPDDCLESAMTDGIARYRDSSYTPQLNEFLRQRQEEWDHVHHPTDNPQRGVIGSILGACYPGSRPGSPTYHNITLRKALDIMALRSLQITRGEARSNGPYYFQPKALSWKFRFRRDPDADNGIGGDFMFQVF